MSLVYRVLRKAYARAPFDGEGAYRYGGRWSSPGTRVAYASQHQSLAMLEYFVHLDVNDRPPDLVLAMADVPDDLPRERIETASLPRNWRQTPAPAELARLGDEFVRHGKTVLLTVPSTLAPREQNLLLNPAHSDFARITLQATEPLFFDERLFRRRHR